MGERKIAKGAVTDRERIEIRALGQSVTEIARRLDISAHTAEELIAPGGEVRLSTLTKVRAKVAELRRG